MEYTPGACKLLLNGGWAELDPPSIHVGIRLAHGSLYSKLTTTVFSNYSLKSESRIEYQGSKWFQKAQDMHIPHFHISHCGLGSLKAEAFSWVPFSGSLCQLLCLAGSSSEVKLSCYLFSR